MNPDLDAESHDLREQRRKPRYSCEHSAELIAVDGAIHIVDLRNISEGGGQVSLSAMTAAALGLPEAKVLPFRIRLPGDKEEPPLEGEARVAYLVVPAEEGTDLLVGLEFQDLADDELARVRTFIDTRLRYLG